jgi:hypothetical protein
LGRECGWSRGRESLVFWPPSLGDGSRWGKKKYTLITKGLKPLVDSEHNIKTIMKRYLFPFIYF